MTIKPFVRKSNYYETDQMGIIHHANYVHWLEEARVDFMEQMGYSYERAAALGIDFAVIGITCDYKSMVRFGETVLIEVAITALNEVKMTVSYKITDAATGKLRATGESRHCYFDSNKRRPVSLKKSIPELYELFDSLFVADKNIS